MRPVPREWPFDDSPALQNFLLVTLEVPWPPISGVSQRLSLVTGMLVERSHMSMVIGASANDDGPDPPGLSVWRPLARSATLPRQRAWGALGALGAKRSTHGRRIT